MEAGRNANNKEKGGLSLPERRSALWCRVRLRRLQTSKEFGQAYGGRS